MRIAGTYDLEMRRWALICMCVTALVRRLRTPRPVLLAGERV
jgi:hypothetical protein